MGVEPISTGLQPVAWPSGSSVAVETMGIEPITGCLQGILAPLAHASPILQRSSWESNPVRHRTGVVCSHNTSRPKSRRPDLNRRRTAHEAVLEPLQSTPQYSRQDSNLRSSPCKGAAVAAGPREYVSARTVGFEPTPPVLETGCSPRSTFLSMASQANEAHCAAPTLWMISDALAGTTQ